MAKTIHESYAPPNTQSQTLDLALRRFCDESLQIIKLSTGVDCFLRGLFPPDLSPEFLLGLVRPLFQTIGISVMGTLPGIILVLTGVVPKDCQLRRVKYVNNVIEQDQRFIEKKVRALQCCKSFHTAERTLEAIEAMNMLRKEQLNFSAG